MIEKETINIAGREVVIDPQILKFDESTLTQYIQTEGGYYDSYGAYLARAEEALALCDMQYDQIYSERFMEAKERGASDKLAESTSKADADVVNAKALCVKAKYKVKRLQQHLRAWDKNHDNAQSLGHMLRKEMDKLHANIISKHTAYEIEQFKQDRKIDQTVQSMEEQTNKLSDGIDMEDLHSIIG